MVILKYLSDAFGGTKLVLYLILLSLVFIGLIVTLILAIRASLRKREEPTQAEEKALGELQRAKEEYEAERKRRINAEEEQQLALADLRDEQIERQRISEPKKQAETLRPEEDTPCEQENDTVNVIYAEIEEDDVLTSETQGEKKSRYGKPKTRIVYKNPEEKAQYPAPPTENDATAASSKSNYNGKWVIENEDVNYVARLKACNGDLLLTSSEYTSLSGVKSAITTIKKNLSDGNATVTVNADGKFVFKALSSSGKTLCVSQPYDARYQCEKALDSAIRFSKTATISQ